jgi:transposase
VQGGGQVLRLDSSQKKRSVNDAARAKDRVVDWDIKAVTPETLTELLGLPGMRVERFAVEEQEGQEYLHLFCEHCHGVAVCPRCGEAMVGGYDSKERSVRHLDIWGRRTIIHFSRRRFDCTVCGKPFTEVLDWIDPKRRQTLAFEQYIYEYIHKKKVTRKQVALQEGLHEETVPGIFKRWGKRAVRRSERQLVQILGIDEIYRGDKEYVLVLSDIERHRVIAVLPNRLKLEFGQKIATTEPFQKRKSIA